MKSLPRPTDEIRERIVAAVKLNVPPEVAAIAAGVKPSLFWQWMARGQAAKTGVIRKLYLDVQQAEADRQTLTLAEIIRIGRGGLVTRSRKTATTRKNGDKLETLEETTTPPQ